MKLFYRKTGQGPALFILHGLYGSGTNWLNIAAKFSEDYTVYLIDLRNHGESPHHKSHTYKEMADDLKELCNTLDIKSLSLIGHSMGGKTAMTFTLQYPGIVKKLICVDISPYSYLDQEHFNEQASFHKLILETYKNAPIHKTNSRKDVEQYFAKFINNKPIRKFLLKNLKRNNTGQFYWQHNIEVLQAGLENIIDSVPTIKLGLQSFIPVLFIQGEKSPYISNEDIEAIPDIFQNARFSTFEKAGHWLHAEYPEKFIHTVQEFLV
jgi:pimeloyl-ACP methyl ester carboxylesterase